MPSVQPSNFDFHLNLPKWTFLLSLDMFTTGTEAAPLFKVYVQYAHHSLVEGVHKGKRIHYIILALPLN